MDASRENPKSKKAFSRDFASDAFQKQSVSSQPAAKARWTGEALELWTSVIFLASRTPRAVKQSKNMLRYQAMRLRALQGTGDAKANILEPDLVALGAIALVDRALLAGAIPPGGKPIRSLVKDAVVKAPPDDRAVLETDFRLARRAAGSCESRRVVRARVLDQPISRAVAADGVECTGEHESCAKAASWDFSACS
jgi:hypothetical protein